MSLLTPTALNRTLNKPTLVDVVDSYDGYVYETNPESYTKFKKNFNLHDFLAGNAEDTETYQQLMAMEEEPLTETIYTLLLANQHEEEISTDKCSDFLRLKDKLNILTLNHNIVYLPIFEDCGSCACAVLADEYKPNPDINGIITFNEQTYDDATESGNLLLSTAGYRNGYTDEKVTQLIQTVLTEAGYLFDPEPWSLDTRNFIRRGSFKTTEVGIAVGGYWNASLTLLP